MMGCWSMLAQTSRLLVGGAVRERIDRAELRVELGRPVEDACTGVGVPVVPEVPRVGRSRRERLAGTIFASREGGACEGGERSNETDGEDGPLSHEHSWFFCRAVEADPSFGERLPALRSP